MNKKKSLTKKPQLKNSKVKKEVNEEKNKKPIKAKKKKEEVKVPAESIVSVALEAVNVKEEPKKLKKRKSLEEKEHYVNGREFEDAITEFYSTNKITDYLGNSIRKIACGLSYAPNFINYSFKEDMIGDAVVKMYQALKHKKFKLNHGFSPFSYFTTIAFHAFISRIKKEKKHHQVLEDYKERQYNSLINSDEEMKSHKIYTKPTSYDNDVFSDNSDY
jgi:hypothetical protein